MDENCLRSLTQFHSVPYSTTVAKLGHKIRKKCRLYLSRCVSFGEVLDAVGRAPRPVLGVRLAAAVVVVVAAAVGVGRGVADVDALSYRFVQLHVGFELVLGHEPGIAPGANERSDRRV